MKRVVACLAAASLLLLAACGGSSQPSPGRTATISPPASRTATGSPGATSPSPAPLPTASVSPTESPPAGATYVVQPGDTLYSIARRFGTTVDAIVQANRLSDPNGITVGQVLIIPGVGPRPSPTPGGPAQVIRRGETARNLVAFSFDAGSDAGYTSQILDTLRANGIRATFGMTGKWAEQNPDLLRRIVNEGHSLINHSYDHPSFTGRSTGLPPLTQQQRWDQLDRTEAIIHQLTGATTMPYFRPPYGDQDDSVNADVGARGYAYDILWTVDSRGWTGIPAAQIVQRCLDLAEPGAIYVFHVGSASQDGPALQAIIDGLRTRGFSIGSVPDVLAP